MNRKQFLDIETNEQVTRYLDELCSDPSFLCKPEHKEMCGTKTSIYSNVGNIDTICKDLDKANICDNDFSECIVLATNLFDESKKYISTSFENIIIPIPKALDQDGNQKFIRLPKLGSNKRSNSMETCSLCACMNRFATSPGGGGPSGGNTAPGQNTCVYAEKFEYYYYPIEIEKKNRSIFQAPNVILGSYTIINNNIIVISKESDLKPVNMYNYLIKNGISPGLSKKFVTLILYKNNQAVTDEMNAYK
jgi:hypothetical protein